MTRPVIRLVVEIGRLHFPGTPEPSMLMRRYPAGDVDTCRWPFDVNDPALAYRLASALYDERETNDDFPDDAVIELPDGTVFDFDTVLVEYERSHRGT